MKDEDWLFVSDVIDKKITARSAMKRRSHAGKGGRVRFPSDNLSKKELQKMSGECKSYRLNDPMTWAEFKSMPDDLKVAYIKALRKKYNVPDKNVAEMFGINKDYIYRQFKALGLGRDVRTSHPKWDKEGFYAWVNGVPKIPTPVIEEEPAEEPIQEVAIFSDEPEMFVEDDLPFDEPDPIPEAVEFTKFVPLTATPCNGSMTFKCPADQALNTLKQLLGSANCSISVMWRVLEGDEDNG